MSGLPDAALERTSRSMGAALRICFDELSDGFRMWNVIVEPPALLAIDRDHAEQLANGIARLIDRHTIGNAKVVWDEEA